MSALSNARAVLPRQWIKSALLHGFLLLCIAVYHWHSFGSLSFYTNGFNKKSTVDLTTSSIHNTHFVELFFEQSPSTETYPTATERTEVSSDTKAEIATDVATDTKIVIQKDLKTEVKTNVQHVTPVRSPRKQTQPTAQDSVSESQAVAKPLQTARPDHAHSPKPAYPLALRDLGVSGVVWLRVWVDKNGRPREIELAKGSGYRLFDEAALRAVQHWHFVPAKNEQQSLASWVEFAVRFEING
jgi:TonB family protein